MVSLGNICINTLHKGAKDDDDDDDDNNNNNNKGIFFLNETPLHTIYCRTKKCVWICEYNFFITQ
jgi:hypothetical protein